MFGGPPTRKKRSEYIAEIGRGVSSMFSRKSNPLVPPVSAVDRMDDLFLSKPPVPTAPHVDEMGVTMVSGPGKLLMISDLEGCTRLNPSQKTQSRAMCQQDFFVAIKNFLDANSANKVAFLGDYFDLGDYVLSTIYEIVKLKETYPNRVHILLGNRDLNKLRLMYELPETIPLPTRSKWTPWNNPGSLYESIATFNAKKFEDGQEKMRLKEKLDLLYAKSFTTPQAPKVKLEDKDVYDSDKSDYMLLRALHVVDEDLSLQEAQDVEVIVSVKKIFQMGQVVTYDKDFKVLLSHAGGADVTAFHSTEFYDAMEAAFNQMFVGGPVDSPDELPPIETDYYFKIEFARQCLQNNAKMYAEMYPEITQVRDVTRYLMNIFDPSIYNAPLRRVVDMLFNPSTKPKLAKMLPFEYFLVQALGLKSDAGKSYASFVNACDVLPMCKGLPVNPMDPHFYTIMRNSGIQAISHGHVNHCAPIPIIYKTEEIFIFIGNDTSSFRPEEINTTQLVPLAYIAKDEHGQFTFGIMAANSNNTEEYKSNFETVFSSSDTAGAKELLQFAPMIGEWSVDTVPTLTIETSGEKTCSVIHYGEHQLTFPSCKGGKPFTQSIMSGGRYKRTHKKKRTKRRGQKKRVTRKRL